MMLCPSCGILVCSIDPHQDQELVLHASVSALESSSKSGCHICRMISTELSNKFDNDSIDRDAIVIAKTLRNAGFRVSFEPALTKPSETSRGDAAHATVYVVINNLEVPGRLEHMLRTLKDVEDSHTGSEPAFKLASTWLAECLESHHHCMPTEVTSTLLPNRVIDVGPPDGSIEPYLLETREQAGSYITLSHCWGGITPNITTLENISSHTAQIKLATLPPTFADAVQVARKLNVQYLWIDSLCIIQNDKRDWEKEAALMGRYYKNSLLTIAATNGKNSEAGLFKKRDCLATRPCELSIRASGGDGEWQQVYAFTNNMSFQISRSSLVKASKSTPLHGRAWVLQEQVLSPRTLTYARNSISWRCQTMRFDEQAPLAQSIEDFINETKRTQVTWKGDPRVIDATVAELQRKWIFPRQVAGEEPIVPAYHKHQCYPDEDQFILDWGRIVEGYTERGLTRQSDKLVAIQGIADEVAALKAAEYIAGVWNVSTEMFVKGLLWCSWKPGNRLTSIAPSWSWASVECAIRWPGHWLCNVQSHIEIIEVKYSGTVSQILGAVTLRTNVRPGIKIKEEEGKIRLIKWPENMPDGVMIHDSKDVLFTGVILDWEKTPISMDEMVQVNTRVWFAELASGEMHGKGGQRKVHSLVLVNDLARTGWFRRVGYCIWEEALWNDPQVSRPELNVSAVSYSASITRVKKAEDHTLLGLRKIMITIV